MKYEITPCPKPRMTQRDKWAKRPCVTRYFAFKDECAAQGVTFPMSGAEIFFYMPMPKSWSKKKRIKYFLTPHQQKPDIDNLLKGLMDACLKDDSKVWQIKMVSKLWSKTGSFAIYDVNI